MRKEVKDIPLVLHSTLILWYSTPLTTELQKAKMDIKAVYDAVDNVMIALIFCRQKVDEKHKWFAEAEKFVVSIDMDIDVKKPRYAQVDSEIEKIT